MSYRLSEFSSLAVRPPRLTSSPLPRWPSSLYPPLLRFFAHLVIYLRLLHHDPPLDPANTILQAYLDVLEEEGKSELVAVYAASLGEQNGATSYARFLKC